MAINDPLTNAVQGYGQYGMGSQGIYDASGKAVLPLVNPADATSDPRGVLAQILRGQWTDYETVFKPIKDAMASYTTYNGSEGLLPTLMKEGQIANDRAFNAVSGMTQRAAAGMGIAPTQRETAALNKQTGMARGIAQVDMQNAARQTQADLNRQIAAGMPTRDDVKNAFGGAA